jgi:hypothetical protein
MDTPREKTPTIQGQPQMLPKETIYSKNNNNGGLDAK